MSPDAKPLARHAWSDRPVVVFAKGPDHPTYERQMALLEAHDAGLRERDVVVYRVLDEGTSSGPDGALSAETVRALRNRFEPKGGFTVLLVGKDTGEKLRRDDVLSARALFETIDAMPMRRREMREGDGPSSD